MSSLSCSTKMPAPRKSIGPVSLSVAPLPSSVMRFLPRTRTTSLVRYVPPALNTMVEPLGAFRMKALSSAETSLEPVASIDDGRLTAFAGAGRVNGTREDATGVASSSAGVDGPGEPRDAVSDTDTHAEATTTTLSATSDPHRPASELQVRFIGVRHSIVACRHEQRRQSTVSEARPRVRISLQRRVGAPWSRRSSRREPFPAGCGRTTCGHDYWCAAFAASCSRYRSAYSRANRSIP